MKPSNAPRTPEEWTENIRKLLKPKDRAACLARIARRMDINVQGIAEIGVFEGAFSAMLRQKWPNAKLWLVDPWKHIPELKKLVGSMHRRGGTAEKNQMFWDKRYRQVSAMFANDPNTTILRMTSREAAALVPDNSLEIVHIDGDHRYDAVCEDIRLWMPKVKAGCLVTGHDYCKGRTQWKGNRAFMYQVYTAVNDTLGIENVVQCRQMTWIYIRRPDNA